MTGDNLDTNGNTVNLGFVDEPYPEGVHMCLIYSDEKERQSVIGKFIDQGLKDGHLTGYFGNSPDEETIRQELKDIGVVLPDDSEKQKLQVANAQGVYCPDNCFNPDKMLDVLKSYHDNAKTDGWPSVRVSGEMGWSLHDIPGSNRLFEYESAVNDLMKNRPFAAICQYDARLFTGEAILAAMKVHPVMIIGGQIVHNPFYMDTATFRQDKQFEFNGSLGI
ncbi:MAG: MEDS domain-containing protein [Magnetococcales bacterium]|nr:MEDS domain-containing protein [Magnetococcales bacterium]